MPTVTLNREVFERMVGKKLPLEQLKDRISMLGTDLERIEGNEIVVEIFPNRPDMLSEQGFARAFSSFIGVKPGLREYPLKKSGAKVIIDKSLKNIRPYTACAIVKNLKLDHEKIREIIQIQEKLHTTFCRNRKKSAIGIYPLEHIKLPITFTARKPGEIKFRPLEAENEMTAAEILEHHPAGKEYAPLVKGLPAYACFVDADNNILSMTPIINSHQTGKVTEKTTEVFIEFSGFDLPHLQVGLNILVTALADMGGEICTMELHYPDRTVTTPSLKPSSLKLELSYVHKVLGVPMKEHDMKKYLEQMGYGYGKGEAFVPAYRDDILHPIDLVEDIAIAYGYEHLNHEIPNVATLAEEHPFTKFERKVVQILLGLGLQELNTYHITHKDTQTKRMNLNMQPVEILDPISTEYNALRLWILPGLMEALQINKTREFPQKLFDIGIIFKPNPETETGVEEATRLGIVLSHTEAGFTEIKQLLDYLIKMLGFQYKIEGVEHHSFIQGRVGRISVQGKNVAYIGEIHPQVLSNFNLEMPVAALELNLTELFEMMKK